MAKIASILQQRFRKKEKPKMSELAEKTSEGELTVFTGVFGTKQLGKEEQEELSALLEKFSPEQSVDTAQDLRSLVAITSEVRAINNQAAILHGERIKQAQTLFKKYRDGAFTAWLLATYGNRQTPYNFLQYYEFYNKIPKQLHQQVESMPRQAIYTLASREGAFEKKEEIVRNYQGETKQEMISLIRTHFPLKAQDKRRENVAETTFRGLQRLFETFEQGQVRLSKEQKQEMRMLLKSFGKLVDICETE